MQARPFVHHGTLPIVKKLRIGVIYGGRSGEHEVSLASAASIIANLDRDRYEPIPIRIEKDGRWTIPDRPPTSVSAGEVITRARVDGVRPPRTGREAHLVPHPSDEALLTIERLADPAIDRPRENAYITGLSLDVIFPVLHGPYGEDGTVQGLLELSDVAYVGAGVLASAVGMDKVVAKALFVARGLPVVDQMVVRGDQWTARQDDLARSVGARLGYPVFVKPANLGSSVGITKVKEAAALPAAVHLAAQFDRKVLIEVAVPEAREIECGVLGNDRPEASVPGEVVPSREFYDYEAKYLDEGSRLHIPAPIPGDVARAVQRLSVEAFMAVDAAGMARVDFLLSRSTGKLYLSEINTIPGFTTISMFAKLWEASGLSYPALVDRLVDLALERHAEKKRLRTSLL